jgi:ribosomal protein S18 acetylase RimI-like enzyme
MNALKIRPATLHDLPTLLGFEQGVINAERPFDVTIKPQHVIYYDIKEMIEQDHVHLLVVEIQNSDGNNQLIGSGYAKIKTAAPHLTHQQYAYLGFMSVAPDYRGQGINQKLIDALMNWSKTRGIDEIRLDVYNDNAGAVRAYEKAGFSKHMVEMRMSLKEG